MIVVDTSALMAIALAEDKSEPCMKALQKAEQTFISAASIAEAMIVATGRGCEAQMAALLEQFGFTCEPVTETRAHAAARAYRSFGKGWHAAGLNYGDSFPYALARELDCPLLYVGDDLSKTDVISAL